MGDFSLFLSTLSKLLSSESFLKMKKWIRRDVHCSQCSLARHWRSRSTTRTRSRDPGRQPKLEKQDWILAFLDQQAVNPFFDLKRLNKEAPLIGYGSISQWWANNSPPVRWCSLVKMAATSWVSGWCWRYKYKSAFEVRAFQALLSIVLLP